MAPVPPEPLVVAGAAGRLVGESAGAGPAVLLLHGLTATRRYVLHGSRALERAGFRVIQYDARGHGESDPPADGDYGYAALAEDALRVLDAAGVDRAVLVGQSMGSATAIAATLAHPDRVSGLVVVTPAHLGHPSTDLDRWDRLSEGLRTGGVDGFMAAYGPPRVPDRVAASVATVIRQRLSRHSHPAAVAEALARTPRTAAFDGLDALRAVTVPVLVVASRDEMDPEHPLAVAEAYMGVLPDAEFLTEDAGESPLAWRGGALSAAIADFLRRRGLA